MGIATSTTVFRQAAGSRGIRPSNFNKSIDDFSYGFNYSVFRIFQRQIRLLRDALYEPQYRYVSRGIFGLDSKFPITNYEI